MTGRKLTSIHVYLIAELKSFSENNLVIPDARCRADFLEWSENLPDTQCPQWLVRFSQKHIIILFL